MAAIKEIAEQEDVRMQSDICNELFVDSREVMSKDYASWFESIPMSEKSCHKGEGSQERPAVQSLSLTGIMHRILAFPIESKSPLQSMAFLAEVKQQLADLI